MKSWLIIIVKGHPKFFDIKKTATPKLEKIKSRLEDISSTNAELFDPTSLPMNSHFFWLLYRKIFQVGQ